MTSYYATFALHIFQGILAALLVGITAGTLAIHLARRTGLMDVPGKAPHKKHAFPTPIAGGLTLALALPVLVMIFRLWETREVLGMLAGALVIFVFGLLDDYRPLGALTKFGGQALAAALLLMFGVSIRVLENPTFFFGGPTTLYKYLDFALTILWVVGITNAFNLVDSMDGLAAGLSGTAFAFFILATLDSNQIHLSRFSSVMFGLCIILYFFNAPPARMFLGDSAAQTLGFLLAALAILYDPVDKYQTSSWFVPVLLVAVPIFDTALVSLSRMRQHRPFYTGGLDHTYHRLVRLGFDSNRAVLVMCFVSLVLDCLAFIAVSQTPLIANSIFGACLVLGLAAMLVLDSRVVRKNEENTAANSRV